MGRKNLIKLESMLDMEIIHNRQQINRFDTLIKFLSKTIGKEETYNLSKEGLALTLPETALLQTGKKYLTRNEITFVFDIAFRLSGDISGACFSTMEDFCEDIFEKENVEASLIQTYELLTGELVNYLGNSGDYEKSNYISSKMIKECLFNRRTGIVADYLYNILWNKHTYNVVDSQCDGCAKSILKECYFISMFIRRKDRIAFFGHKLFN